jgi:hypothetical protein
MPKDALTEDPQTVISRYAAVARPILIDFYGVKSCVESTRITIGCLKRFGVKAAAVPVSLRAKSAEAGWFCGLTEEELEQLPVKFVDGCPPDQAWRGHHVAMAEGKCCRYLIDASFDQVRLDGILIPPMVLFFEAAAESPSTRLGTFEGFLYVELALNQDGAPIAEVLELAYKEIADRSFEDPSAGEIDALGPAIDLICERMMEL